MTITTHLNLGTSSRVAIFIERTSYRPFASVKDLGLKGLYQPNLPNPIMVYVDPILREELLNHLKETAN